MEKKKNVLAVLFSRKFLTLFVCYTLSCLTFSCVGSIFITYGTEHLTIDAVAVGAVAGMVSMIGLIMRPISAIIVDKFNRKYMLLLSYVMLAISSIIIVFVHSVPGLYAAQIIRGTAWALNSSAGYIMVAEIVEKDDLGTAISVYSMAMVIAASFSAVLIMGIANAYGYQACFIVTAAFGILAALLLLTIPSSKKLSLNSDESLLESFKTIRLSNLIAPKCLPIVVISFGFQFVSVMMSASWVLKFAKGELGILNAGLFATIANVIMYFTKPLFGKIMDKWGCRWNVYASGIGYAVASIVAANAKSLTMLYVVAVIFGVLCGGNAMAARTMAMKMMPRDRQAVGTSTVGLGNDIGMTLANIAIPMWAAMFGGFSGVYYIMAAIAGFILVYSVIYGRIYLKKNPDNTMNW